MIKRAKKRSVVDDSSNDVDSRNHSSLPRSGKWTTEEEKFANRLILDFETGILVDCEEGCTLRSYLARRLNCAPMRISKKFAGRCIGKHVFVKRAQELVDNFFSLESTPPISLQELEENFRKSYSTSNESRITRLMQSKLSSTSSSSSTDYTTRDDSLCNSSDDGNISTGSSENARSNNISQIYDSVYPQNNNAVAVSQNRTSNANKKAKTVSGVEFGYDLSHLSADDYGFNNSSIVGLDIEEEEEESSMLKAHKPLIEGSSKLIQIEVDEWRDVLSFFCNDVDVDCDANGLNTITRNDQSFLRNSSYSSLSFKY